MPISNYLQKLRDKVGTDLVMLTGVAGIVRDGERRILLARRTDDNSWTLPAGAIDPGEEPARAMIREVWEETGLKVEPVRVLGVFGGVPFRHTYPNGDQVEATVIVFECRTIGGELAIRDGESVELKYFAPDALPVLVMPYPREFLNPPAENAVTCFQWDPAWLEELDD
jgi:8-oxo-dGTP pyrophosphatase MutT (NUDIX family)